MQSSYQTNPASQKSFNEFYVQLQNFIVTCNNPSKNTEAKSRLWRFSTRLKAWFRGETLLFHPAMAITPTTDIVLANFEWLLNLPGAVPRIISETWKDNVILQQIILNQPLEKQEQLLILVVKNCFKSTTVPDYFYTYLGWYNNPEVHLSAFQKVFSRTEAFRKTVIHSFWRKRLLNLNTGHLNNSSNENNAPLIEAPTPVPETILSKPVEPGTTAITFPDDFDVNSFFKTVWEERTLSTDEEILFNSLDANNLNALNDETFHESNSNNNNSQSKKRKHDETNETNIENEISCDSVFRFEK